MKVEHPLKPGLVIYDGPTQLSYYECQRLGCAFEGIAYQIRERLPERLPVYPPAQSCTCGSLRAKIPNTSLPE